VSKTSERERASEKRIIKETFKFSFERFVMRWRKLLFLLALITLFDDVELKGGRGGGGGGFKLFGFRKSSNRNNLKPKAKAMKVPQKDNEISKNKYFNRDQLITSKDYGGIFASNGLSSNSYIYNNYYKTHSRQMGIAQFLTNALFFRAGFRLGREMSQYDDWSEEDDKRWRMTTKAPYFENTVPGKD
jgi:hypothetical protein